MNTPTDDMNKVGILQLPDNLCYSGQCVNDSEIKEICKDKLGIQ